MDIRTRILAILAFATPAVLALAGCSNSSAEQGNGGGAASASGGTIPNGSGGSGGKAATGGSGDVHTGGSPSSGGSTVTSSSAGTGGKGSTGGSTSGGSGNAGGNSAPASGGSGGKTAAGGSVHTGGSPSSGGNATTSSAGTGGKGSTGGSTNGAGGKGSTGGSTSGGSTSGAGGSSQTQGSCTFTANATTSSKIATVGIVTWSTDFANVQSAHIDFGQSSSYGMTAPVDIKAKDYRTLLLGMKQSKTYHYRIVASDGTNECASPDYTIATGTLTGSLPKITAKTNNASALYGGFLLVGHWVMSNGSKSSPALILDADNEIVWAYTVAHDTAGVRMDYAGTHMWLSMSNVPSATAKVNRVTMDGLTDEDLSSKFTGLSHQLTILPDETVAFYAYGSSCDDIKEYSPTGTVKTVVNSGTAQGGVSPCHVNNIQYSKEDDTLVFSDLDNQSVVKVKRNDGSAVWILNSSKATIKGDTWKGSQHGIHLLGLDHLVLFNNNSSVSMGGGASPGGSGDGSIVLDLLLDLSGKKVSKTGSYKANPSIQNDVMGDVQRLANGNTIVGYSSKNVVQEVDANGTVLQELSFPNSFGYFEKRETLYGPPPR